MNIKSIIKAVFIIILIVLILHTIRYSILSHIFGSNITKKEIMNIFYENKVSFELIVEELKEDNKIYIDKENGNIIIKRENNTNMVEIKQEEFYKYKNTMEIMQKLKIMKVKKEDSNIIIYFGGTIGFGQYIVQLNNEELYRNNYIVTDMTKIEDNWHYIETK